MTLNNWPICSSWHSRVERDVDLLRPVRDARSQALHARAPIPSRSSQSPCVDHGRRRHAVIARCAPERLEIDVGGQILLAGIDEHRDVAMAANRLQRVARALFARGRNR